MTVIAAGARDWRTSERVDVIVIRSDAREGSLPSGAASAAAAGGSGARSFSAGLILGLGFGEAVFSCSTTTGGRDAVGGDEAAGFLLSGVSTVPEVGPELCAEANSGSRPVAAKQVKTPREKRSTKDILTLSIEYEQLR
jgi:hypothetical protein